MTRRQSRESAFFAVFEYGVNGNDAQEIFSAADEAETYKTDEYSRSLAQTVFDNLPEIDEKISAKLSGWSISRISRTALAVLRVAVAELLFVEEVPDSIAINEAVEIAKRYCGEDEYQFINGVLGSVQKEL